MTVINKRLEPVFRSFCENHCKHRVKKKCSRTLKKPALILCPIGEWWDLNDYLNDIKSTIEKIQESIGQKS